MVRAERILASKPDRLKKQNLGSARIPGRITEVYPPSPGRGLGVSQGPLRAFEGVEYG